MQLYQLAGVLRQTPAMDDEMRTALTLLDQELTAYHKTIEGIP